MRKQFAYNETKTCLSVVMYVTCVSK